MTYKIKRPAVEQLKDDALEREYSLFLCALGYEQRARYVAQHCRPRSEKSLAVAFPWQHEFSYDSNLEYFSTSGFHVEEVSDAQFASWIMPPLNEALEASSAARICIDITSFSRFRLAVLIDCIRRIPKPGPVIVDFVYSLARFSGPPLPATSNEHAGPVLPAFTGWALEPERGPTAVVGLGYEHDKALGAVELLQAPEIWTFEPISSETEYTAQVEIANASLLSFVPTDHRLKYRVEHPYALFAMLESLIYGSLQFSNPVILPFGPKIFALASLLVACLHEELAVWRVSGGKFEPALERQAQGYVGGFSTVFSD